MASDSAPSRLGILADFINGDRSANYPRPSDSVAVGIPFISATDITPHGLASHFSTYITAAAYERLRSGHVRKGDILFCLRGSIGKMALVAAPLRAAIASSLVIVRPLADADPHFVYYTLRSPAVQALALARDNGSAQPNLSVKELSQLAVPKPPLPEQRAIAHILGTLDDKIDLNRQMSATLEAMARALFESWFVRFDPVRAKEEGRDTGLPADIAALFPDSFEQSELGQVPRGWRVAPLGESLSTLETGGRPKGGVAGVTSGVPSIGAESIVGIGVFDFNKTKYVPVDFYNGMRKGHLSDGDVLLYKDGGRPGEFEPHVSMVSDDFPFKQSAINEHVYRIRSHSPLKQDLLYLLLSTERVMDEMRRRGTGVAIPGLPSHAVRAIPVLVPPHSVAAAVSRHTEPICRRILNASKQSQHFATLRDTLLPKLISGDLRVPDAERFLADAGV